MGLVDGRAEAIALFMERIAPSEEGAVTTFRGSDGGTMIFWNLLPPDLLELQCMIAAVEQRFIALVSLRTDGEDEPTVGEPALVATAIHTDDEIARKVLVYGAEVLDKFRTSALRNQNLELAKSIGHYHDLIQEGLRAWGAGNTRSYEGASPKLNSGVDRGLAAWPAQQSSEMNQLQRVKNRAWLWIVVNVGMILVAAATSIGTYQDAAANGGGTYYVWWGPVVWGVINLFRFGARLSRVYKLQHQLDA
jgi:hypothetical protein